MLLNCLSIGYYLAQLLILLESVFGVTVYRIFRCKVFKDDEVILLTGDNRFFNNTYREICI